MKLPEPFAPIKDVLRNRVLFAPKDVRRKTFGSEDAKSSFWQPYPGEQFYALAVGSSEFQRQVQDFDRHLKVPLPGIVRKGFVGSSGIELQNGRAIVVESSTFSDLGASIVLHPGSTFMLVQTTMTRVGGYIGTWVIPLAFVFWLNERLSIEEASEDFDQSLVRVLSPNILRT